jgi:hypothetical protein
MWYCPYFKIKLRWNGSSDRSGARLGKRFRGLSGRLRAAQHTRDPVLDGQFEFLQAGDLKRITQVPPLRQAQGIIKLLVTFQQTEHTI